MNKYLLATLWTLPLIYEVQAAPPPGFPVYDVEANCIQYLKQSDKKARERYEYKLAHKQQFSSTTELWSPMTEQVFKILRNDCLDREQRYYDASRSDWSDVLSLCA